METDIEQKLKDENLELKLSAIRVSIENVVNENRKEHGEILLELKDILQHVKKTNGSVARVTQRLSELEQKNELKQKEFEDLRTKVNVESKEMKLWRVISTNKWVMILMLVFIYLLGSNDFRDLVLSLVSKIR